VVETLGILAAMVAAGYAGYLVFHGLMDPAKFLTWMAALFAMMDPIRKLAKVSMRFQASDAGRPENFRASGRHRRASRHRRRHAAAARQEHRVPRRELPLPPTPPPTR